MHTIILDNSSYGRLGEPNGSSEHIQIMVEGHDIAQLALAQVVLESIKVGFSKVVELCLYSVARKALFSVDLG